jgi:probable F420-dependent oxidoreductase
VDTVKFGIAFANIGPNIEPEMACELAVSAETAGFESIWTADHIVVTAGYRSTYPYDPTGRLPSGEDAPFPESLIWLAYVARATSTIRLATGILILPERNPVILAKELATLDYLSSGRVTLGVGIGWLKEEFEAIGVPYAGRGARMEESIAAMRALWGEECATFEGTTVRFTDVYLRPQPRAGTIPIHIGGHTEIAARRAGRIGDGFFPFGVDRGQLRGLLGSMRESAEAAGRDPSSIDVTVSSFATGDDEAALADVAELAALGATRVVIPAALFPGDTAEALAHYGHRVIDRL